MGVEGQARAHEGRQQQLRGGVGGGWGAAQPGMNELTKWWEGLLLQQGGGGGGAAARPPPPPPPPPPQLRASSMRSAPTTPLCVSPVTALATPRGRGE